MPQDAPANAKRVLLVQDDLDEENVALRALSKCGVPMRVVVARDGREAIDILFSLPEVDGTPLWTPDLIMLDLGLPKLDGLEVLQQIRSSDRTMYTPVVITSGSQDPVRLKRALESGANSVLKETIDYEAHIESLALAAKYWLVAHRAVMI
jgi:two-component system, response regulator